MKRHGKIKWRLLAPSSYRDRAQHDAMSIIAEPFNAKRSWLGRSRFAAGPFIETAWQSDL